MVHKSYDVLCVSPRFSVEARSKDTCRRMFQRSVWFQRGWTLQELLVPSQVIFCDQDWTVYGWKIQLARQIKSATGIAEAFLSGSHKPQEASVVMGMSWVSRRTTTKSEDMAYCLLGLFDVNMPLPYGEGHRAFMRLQEWIIKKPDDESIFARTSKEPEWGMMESSPRAFSSSGSVVNIRLRPEERMPYFMTDKSLPIQSSSDTDARNRIDVSIGQPMGYSTHTVQLGCFFGRVDGTTDEDPGIEEMWENGALTVKLERRGQLWMRTNCNH